MEGWKVSCRLAWLSSCGDTLPCPWQTFWEGWCDISHAFFKGEKMQARSFHALSFPSPASLLPFNFRVDFFLATFSAKPDPMEHSCCTSYPPSTRVMRHVACPFACTLWCSSAWGLISTGMDHLFNDWGGFYIFPSHEFPLNGCSLGGDLLSKYHNAFNDIPEGQGWASAVRRPSQKGTPQSLNSTQVCVQRVALLD